MSRSVATDSLLPHGQAPPSMRGKDASSYFITELVTSPIGGVVMSADGKWALM